MLDRIDTLLIDLCGVLVGADHTRCITAFSALTGRSDEEVRTAIYDSDLAERFELGECDSSSFRQALRTAFGENLVDDALDAAWCTTLFPLDGTAELLEELAVSYKLILASNTNPIHFEAVLEEHPGWARLFGGYHLSFEVGVAKPEPEYFERIAWRFSLDRERCLFLDDSAKNVLAAEHAHLRAALVTPPGLRRELLAQWEQ